MKIKAHRPQDIRERTFDFAIRVLKFTETLPRNSINNALIHQNVRWATSIGANIVKKTNNREFDH